MFVAKSAHSNCQRSSLSPTVQQDEDCTHYKTKDKRKFPTNNKSSSLFPATSSTPTYPSTCTSTSTLKRCPSSVPDQSKGIITRQSSHKSSTTEKNITKLQRKKNKEQTSSSTIDVDVASKTPIVSILKDNIDQDHNGTVQRIAIRLT